MALVWTCADGATGTGTDLAAAEYPTCAAGSGAWVEYEPAGAFDAVAYFETSGQEWGQYFGAGFTFVSLGIILAWGVRVLLRFIRNI